MKLWISFQALGREKLAAMIDRTIMLAIKAVREIPVDAASDYLAAKSLELRFIDSEQGRQLGMSQFLDQKTYRPGLQPYARPEK